MANLSGLAQSGAPARVRGSTSSAATHSTAIAPKVAAASADGRCHPRALLRTSARMVMVPPRTDSHALRYGKLSYPYWEVVRVVPEADPGIGAEARADGRTERRIGGAGRDRQVLPARRPAPAGRAHQPQPGAVLGRARPAAPAGQGTDGGRRPAAGVGRRRPAGD